MRVAVVGHVEWVEFTRVARVPRAGEVVHGGAGFAEPAGGGAAAAAQLAALAGEAHLFTALGEDELGERARARLAGLGVVVHAATRAQPTRRALTLIDDAGERTITTLGERLAPAGADALPWELLAGADAVYFAAGDAAALSAARAARRLVATPRARAAATPPVRLDALVLSAGDPAEVKWAHALAASADIVVSTRGAAGGRWRGAGASGEWVAAKLPGAICDSYGCGDAFAAGLTYGLGAGMTLAAALELGARCGATCLTGHGPYGRLCTA